jgi:hypothetical protein
MIPFSIFFISSSTHKRNKQHELVGKIGGMAGATVGTLISIKAIVQDVNIFESGVTLLLYVFITAACSSFLIVFALFNKNRK